MSEGSKELRLLVDTNVWLEYFLERSNHDSSFAAIHHAYMMYDLIAVTPTITKDVFYTLGKSIKGRIRSDGLSIASGLGGGSNVAGWACLKVMQELAVILNVGMPEHYKAMELRNEYTDYEDDLLIATAKIAKLDYILTNDKKLTKNEVVPAITPQQYLALERS